MGKKVVICPLIDFGDWAAEKHSIPSEMGFPEVDENQEKLQ